MDIEFGERIREARKTKKLTQEAVAADVPIPLRTLQRIEAGQIPKDIKHLWALVQYLDVSADALPGTRNDVNAATDNHAGHWDHLCLRRYQRLMVCRQRTYISSAYHYYCIAINYGEYCINTNFEGWEPTVVDPLYIYDSIYADTNQPPLVLNELEDIDIFLWLGGYALVQTDLYDSHMRYLHDNNASNVWIK